MMKRLTTIDELYNFKNIKEYIIIYKNKNIIKKHKIKDLHINKPNYQLYTEYNGTINLAYGYIPDYINFIILNNNKLIKVLLDKPNEKIIMQLDKNNQCSKKINSLPINNIINIKNINCSQVNYDDDETVDIDEDN